jgi:lysosomal-associated membrane protein 1/2
MMFRIVFLLIAIFALARAQSTNATTNSTTIEPMTNPNITTLSPTTKPTVSPTTQNPTIPPTESPVLWSGNVTENKTNTCINIKFMVQIAIKYNSSTGQNMTAFNIPANASVIGDKSHCSSETLPTETIFIRFVDEEYTSADLVLTFNKSDGNVFVEEIELTFNLTKTLFPDYIHPDQYDKKVTVTKKKLNLFSVSKSHSYLCVDAQTAQLDTDKNIGLETEIRFTNSQVQAYIDSSRSGKFDSEINCKTTEINDVVPIAVGAALAGLVIIVLIAYFVGRRRSRRLAYQSV